MVKRNSKTASSLDCNAIVTLPSDSGAHRQTLDRRIMRRRRHHAAGKCGGRNSRNRSEPPSEPVASSISPKVDWDSVTAARIAWLEGAADSLPIEFELVPGITVIDPQTFVVTLLRDVQRGPDGPRGELVPSDLKLVQAAIGPRRIENRPSASRRGYTAAWRAARDAHLEAHPFCVSCLERGIERKAREVDHRPPITGPDDPGLLDPSRFRSACRSCHATTTHEDRRRGLTRLYERACAAVGATTNEGDGSA
jgi:5-methylcytosine-specific restriction enzyme A